MAYIRQNPTHAPTTGLKLGAVPSIGGPKSVASMVKGPLYAHLGHFAQPGNLARGHNSNGHPGFEKVQAKIAKSEGVSKDRAGAILAASSRNASAAAKRRNPRLRRVKG